MGVRIKVRGYRNLEERLRNNKSLRFSEEKDFNKSGIKVTLGLKCFLNANTNI